MRFVLATRHLGLSSMARAAIPPSLCPHSRLFLSRLARQTDDRLVAFHATFSRLLAPLPQRAGHRVLGLGKAPLFALSVVMAIVTQLAQGHGGAVTGMDVIPLVTRLQNAVIAYLVYLAQFVWPARLAVFYPYEADPSLWTAVAAVAALLAASAFFYHFRTRAYLVFGWLWFLITLVPVIGLIQIGAQVHADRYMYIPMVGDRDHLGRVRTPAANQTTPHDRSGPVRRRAHGQSFRTNERMEEQSNAVSLGYRKYQPELRCLSRAWSSAGSRGRVLGSHPQF